MIKNVQRILSVILNAVLPKVKLPKNAEISSPKMRMAVFLKDMKKVQSICWITNHASARTNAPVAVARPGLITWTRLPKGMVLIGLFIYVRIILIRLSAAPLMRAKPSSLQS